MIYKFKGLCFGVLQSTVSKIGAKVQKKYDIRKHARHFFAFLPDSKIARGNNRSNEVR